MRKGPKRGDRRRPRELYRVNHRIRVPQVRVVMEDGEQLGILSRDEALQTAQDKGLDLVEITARANPPVCRIMDYGRFKYEQAKKAKAAKKHASTVELKEIKFRPKTDEHDLEFKIKHVTRFIEDGNKCRLVVIFRGREVVHPKTGLAVLNRVLAETSEIAQVEVRPNLEGKRMIMIIGPKPGVQQKRKPEKSEQASKRNKGKASKAVAEKTLEELNAAAEAEAAEDALSEEAQDIAPDDTVQAVSEEDSAVPVVAESVPEAVKSTEVAPAE